MSHPQNPEQRAAEAAEALAAEGTSVTARAVRERSGVRMTVAATAARSWNDTQAKEEPVPDMPQSVQTRLEAAWREAVRAARAEFAEARAGWQGKVDEVTGDRDAMAKEVETVEAVEAERDRLLTERNKLLAERDELRDQVRESERASGPK